MKWSTDLDVPLLIETQQQANRMIAITTRDLSMVKLTINY